MGNFTSTFSKFESLPKELRLLVWEQAIDSIEPGFVIIRRFDVGDPYINRSNPFRLRFFNQSIYANSAPVPALLQADQEAREVALKNYRPMFADVSFPNPPLYFNPDEDRLHLCNVHRRGTGETEWEDLIAFSPLLRQDLALVKHLVVYRVKPDFLLYRRYPETLMPYESLVSLSVAADPCEELQVDKARRWRQEMEYFWITNMNPE